MNPPELLETLLQVAELSHGLRLALSAHVRRAAGLTLQQAIALCRIDLAGGHITISELAALLGRASHSVTALVDNMEREGLVSRLRRDEDRRRVWVQLDPAGTDKLRLCRNSLQDFVVSTFGRQTDEELRAIKQTVQNLSAFLDR